VYECDVEILPSASSCPRLARGAHRAGKDYEYEGDLDAFGKSFHYSTRGTGGMTHNDPISRPRDVFGGAVTLHTAAIVRPTCSCRSSGPVRPPQRLDQNGSMRQTGPMK